MKSSFASTAVLGALISTLPASSLPTDTINVKRGGGGVVELAWLIGELIKNEHNAYDPSNDNAYVVSMKTYDGGGCEARVQSAFSYQSGYPNHNAVYDKLSPITGLGDWNVCYVGGRQYFNDPNIGDFSITFSEAGGVNGNTEDGLHTPILQVKNIGNWAPIDVEGLSKADGSKLCQRDGTGSGRILGWSCGIPAIGKSFFDYTNVPPLTATTYKKGSCGVHFVQHQIPSGGGKYGFSALIKDADGQPIGMLGDPYTTGEDHEMANLYDEWVSMDSLLPWTLDAKVGTHDNDAIQFKYSDQSWDTNEGPHHCSVGAYDNGARQGDCGFQC